MMTMVALATWLGGCAADGPGEFAVPPERYAAAINATRDVLREYRFEIDRVDASMGVVTTRPKSTDGLFTPWDTEQSTFSQEWEDTLNDQRRRVEVRFSREGDAQVLADRKRGDPLPASLLDEPGATTARVTVIVERLQRPGWRPATESVRLSTYTSDPALAEEGLEPVYAIRLSDDPPLAARLAREIQKRMESAPLAGEAPTVQDAPPPQSAPVEPPRAAEPNSEVSEPISPKSGEE